MNQIKELGTDAMKFITGGYAAPKLTDNPTIICGGPNHGDIKADTPIDDTIKP